MDIVVDKIVGQPDAGQWGQVHEFEKNGEHLVAVVGLSQPKLAQVEILGLGREVISRLHELFFGQNGTLPVLERVKTATTQAVAEFTGLQLALVVIKHKIAYIGSVQAGVWTHGEMAEGWVSQFESDSIRVFSGRLAVGQVLVVGNGYFWQKALLGAVKAAVLNPEAAETLGTMVHGQEGLQGAAVALVRLGEKQAELTKVASAGLNFKWWDGWQERLAKFIPKPTGPIYVSYEHKSDRRKRTMWLGVGFLILLMLLVVAGQIRRVQTDQNRLITLAALEDLHYKFTQASALLPLNQSRSKELFLEVQQGLDTLKTNKLANKDERYQTMVAQLAVSLELASGINPVSLETLLDLSLIRSDLKGNNLETLEGDLLVLDKAQSRLVKVDPLKKSGSVIAGLAQLNAASLLAVYPGKLVLLSDKGLIQCSIINVQCSLVVESDADWGKVIDIGVFGGNIYLLTDGGIWRYQVTAKGGYGAKQEWLSEADPSLVQATSMAIDGFVWVALTDGTISKYTRGVKENFVVSELEKPWSGLVRLYTSDTVDHLYLLDTTNARVVAIAKTGVYAKQYFNPQFKEAIDLVVDEQTKKLYILTQSKVLFASLQP